jgi:hypothetical protein
MEVQELGYVLLHQSLVCGCAVKPALLFVHVLETKAHTVSGYLICYCSFILRAVGPLSVRSFSTSDLMDWTDAAV